MANKDYTNAGAIASAAGIPIIDSSTDEAFFGGEEINITRDLIASRSRVVTALPASGKPGDIYFLIGGF